MIYHNKSDKIDVKGEVRQFFYWIPYVAPMTKSVDSPSKSDSKIVNKWIPSVGRMTELVDALSRSDVTWFLFTQFWTL